MTATDTAVIAGRFIDVPKLRGHYREVPGTPWFCTVAGPARRPKPTSVRTSVRGARCRASTPSAPANQPDKKANSERHTS
jgi:hypothetical protein